MDLDNGIMESHNGIRVAKKCFHLLLNKLMATFSCDWQLFNIDSDKPPRNELCTVFIIYLRCEHVVCMALSPIARTKLKIVVVNQSGTDKKRELRIVQLCNCPCWFDAMHRYIFPSSQPSKIARDQRKCNAD